MVMNTNRFGFTRPFKRIGRKLEIHWNALQNNTTGELNNPQQVDRGKVTLFETQFENKSPEDQTFDFKVERSTETTLEISVQKGVTIGKNMKCSFSIKPASQIQIGGELGKDVKLEEKATDKYHRSDRLMWGVNAPVKVTSGKRATVSLHVDEVETEGDLTISTIATILTDSKKIPVYAISKKDNKVVGLAHVGVNELCSLDKQRFTELDDAKSFCYKSHAKLKSKHSVRQKVSVKFEDLTTLPQLGPTDRPSNMVPANEGASESVPANERACESVPANEGARKSVEENLSRVSKDVWTSKLIVKSLQSNVPAANNSFTNKLDYKWICVLYQW